MQICNLNEEGSESFRAACETTGECIVVFGTGGTILPDRKIRIINPYITIAGQTAPGDGILIRGAAIQIQTHGVIIRELHIRAVEQIFDLILGNAGAITPVRDEVDMRVVKSVGDGNGRVINSQDEVGGWPQMAWGVPLMDSDRDGMPDSWEISRGLNPNDARDGGMDRNGDGYTNIEEYLNSLIPDASSIE